MIVTLQPITRDNVWQCIRLKVAPEQEHYVASNAVSLAQAAYETECVPLAAYDGDTMVGFAMYAWNKDESTYWIYRVMVGRDHQRKGYGKALMRALLDRLQSLPNSRKIAISYETDNDVARRLYQQAGFVETGEVVEGETVARLPLGTALEQSAH